MHALTSTKNYIMNRIKYLYLIGLVFLFSQCKVLKPPAPTSQQEVVTAYGMSLDTEYDVMITPEYLIDKGYVDQEDRGALYLAQRQWRWPVDKTIYIRLNNPPPGRKQEIREVCDLYEAKANHRIKIVLDPPVGVQEQHRWSFVPGSAWMIMGSVVEVLNDKTRPTGNIGFTGKKVLWHEIGHMFNLGHSHQCGCIPWNKSFIYAYMAARGWSQAQINSQIIFPANPDLFEIEGYYENDFMGYDYPPSWRTDGVSAFGQLIFLPSHDKYFNKYYPPKATPPIIVTPPDNEKDNIIAQLRVELDKCKVNLKKKQEVISRVINSWLSDTVPDFIDVFNEEFFSQIQRP